MLIEGEGGRSTVPNQEFKWASQKGVIMEMSPQNKENWLFKERSERYPSLSQEEKNMAWKFEKALKKREQNKSSENSIHDYSKTDQVFEQH